MRDDRQQSDALEHYWRALIEGNDARSESLKPGVADVVNRLDSLLSPPSPSVTFRDQLGRRIDQQLQRRVVASKAKSPWRRWRLAAPVATLAVAAAMLIAILIGSGALSSSPHSVSAAEILHRAQAVAIAPPGGGMRSFKLIEQTYIRPGNSGLGGFVGTRGIVRITSTRWYRAPNLWRIERRYRSLPANPLIRNSYEYPTLEVSDGKTYRSYDAHGHSIETYPVAPGLNGIYDLLPFGRGATSVASVLRSYKTCYNPGLRGTGEVAGRAVFTIDLGTTHCPSNSAHAADGRLVLSIDRHTFLVLKSELYDVYDKSLPYITNTITRINYDVSTPASTFVFKPPASKPVPAPTLIPIPRDANVAQLRHLLPFPIFVPTRIPHGLKPHAPHVGPGINPVVMINYRDGHGQVALSVADGAAFCCIDNDPRKYGIRIGLRHGLAAHLLDFGAGFGGLDLWWEENGAFVSISGPSLSKGALFEIARSMSQIAVPHAS